MCQISYYQKQWETQAKEIMTTNSEKLSLKWNDFENNLSSAFTELRHDKELFDVTLVCDKNQIEAHKVVISACSPFFRRILKRSPHSHPLLYLKGVPFTDLESVLNFMYQGEVSISQDHLNSFLATAEELEVKGLTEGSGGAGSCTSAGRGNPNHETSHGTQFRAAMKPQSFVSAETGDSDIMEIAPVKMEASFSSVVVVDHQEEGYEFQDQDQEGFHYEDYNSYVSENIGLDQGKIVVLCVIEVITSQPFGCKIIQILNDSVNFYQTTTAFAEALVKYEDLNKRWNLHRNLPCFSQIKCTDNEHKLTYALKEKKSVFYLLKIIQVLSLCISQ